MVLKDIAKAWLREHGYDGLCNTECGCRFEDFMLCGEPGAGCEAAYETKAPEDADEDYWMTPGKKEAPGA